MRIGAFVSLPVQAVDISNLTVSQFPSLGVRTKNCKYATTILLDIPELLKIVQAWDNEVRSILPPSGFWFAPLSPETGQVDIGIKEIGEHRISLARRNFKQWLEQAGLSYRSPHKFRHGHIHYLLDRAKSVPDLKAASMNAMHSSMEITDQFYSVLRDEELKNRISALSKSNNPNDQQSLVKLLEDLLANIKGG
jgi:integrase